MATGTVEWFNTDKGYGFIAPDAGGGDVFVHVTAVQRTGLQSLSDDRRFSMSWRRAATAKQAPSTCRHSKRQKLGR